jgi:RNAse (barnase) inhibitor barstar
MSGNEPPVSADTAVCLLDAACPDVVGIDELAPDLDAPVQPRKGFPGTPLFHGEQRQRLEKPCDTHRVADDIKYLWVNGELSWVGLGFIHRLPRNIKAGIADLEALGFKVVRLDGTKITDRESFHTEVASTFGFPDYYGRNWDGFHDCFGDLELPSHLAIVWTDADRLAAGDLKTFAEAVCVLHDEGHNEPKLRSQLELFIGFGRHRFPSAGG